MPAYKFKLVAAIGVIACSMLAQSASAAVSQSPLLDPKPAKPNIMFTLDNSQSMLMVSLTSFDGLGAYDQPQSTRAFYSSSYNLVYYNPAIRYTPGVKSDGSSMPNITPSAAPIDPYETDNRLTGTVNLEALCYSPSSPTLPFYTPPKHGTNIDVIPRYTPNTTNCKDVSGGGATVLRARYAHYYKWDGSTNIATNNLGTKANSAFPTRVDIMPSVTSYPKAAARTDCAGSSCSHSEEIQNFANWFSYYRTRILMAKTAMGQAFAILDDNYRLGFNTINGIDDKGNITENNTAVKDGRGWLTIRDFTTAQREKFYAKLYAINPDHSTPLRAQLNRIGKMFLPKDSGLKDFDYDKEDPFYADAANDNKTMVSCRANYHILSTDGYWNDDSKDTNFPDVKDPDGVAGPNTLADVAKYYYDKDLRPDLANNVPPTSTDSVTHQHLVTFTVGLGASGTLAYDENYYRNPAYNETKANGVTWPTPVKDDSKTIDDLWHAAVNSKGRYFSAKNPVQLREGLIKALNDIASRSAAGSAIAINIRSSIAGDGLAYVPSYETNSWLGHLKAYKIKPTGEIDSVLQWDAATLLPAWNARSITTWSGSAGINFDWAALSADQQTALGSKDVLDYLRGNGAKETTQSGGVFRERATKLGDIVGSPVLYVKDTNFAYDRLPSAEGGDTYGKFLDDKIKLRPPMIYAGANDGMLHAFDAKTGVEKFAFVPNGVFPKLKSLSSPQYAHQFFVDGPLAEGDAYLSGKWKTMLVGSAGAGAKSVFAMDVTDPAALGSSSVSWELSDKSDDDFGYVLGKPAIVNMGKDKWMAVFGNGYESKNGHALLYMVNLATKAVTKIDTGETATGNGLSAPAFQFDSQRRVTAIYAGDLLGNLWKFDIANGGSPIRLFTAKNGNAVQPITQKPALGHHAKGGLMVMFGTGKFFESSDPADKKVQSIYGIWDQPKASPMTGDRTANLEKGTLSSSGSVTDGVDLAIGTIDWTTRRGWYIDLDLVVNSGERAIGNPFTTENILWINTLSPENDGLCSGSGTSTLFAIDFQTGGPSAISPFDLNKDGKFDDKGATVGLKQKGSTADPTLFETPRCADPSAANCKNGKPSCTAGDSTCPAECSGGKRNYLRNNLDNTTSLISVAPSCKPPKRVWRQIPYSY